MPQFGPKVYGSGRSVLATEPNQIAFSPYLSSHDSRGELKLIPHIFVSGTGIPKSHHVAEITQRGQREITHASDDPLSELPARGCIEGQQIIVEGVVTLESITSCPLVRLLEAQEC